MSDIFKKGQLVFVLFPDDTGGFLADIASDEDPTTSTVRLGGYPKRVSTKYLRVIDNDLDSVLEKTDWDVRTYVGDGGLRVVRGHTLEPDDVICPECKKFGFSAVVDGRSDCRVCNGKGWVRK